MKEVESGRLRIIRVWTDSCLGREWKQLEESEVMGDRKQNTEVGNTKQYSFQPW